MSLKRNRYSECNARLCDEKEEGEAAIAETRREVRSAKKRHVLISEAIAKPHERVLRMCIRSRDTQCCSQRETKYCDRQ